MCEVCLMADMFWQDIQCITVCTIQSPNDRRYVSANSDHSGTVLWGFLPFALFYKSAQEKINLVI